ncbi:excinuclease ABC subunit UvrC [Candidatus Dojkabacteria bacterium]|uniref:Excinuclease ABC subunit UvrC n=1 Tax=Candidatus Dojkabacteria bacterium TaxID=2099670 RepID=A0A847VCP3_9BACT|nr:excinuclease ABC subunit UvrC [Candidatus Dojkabacteria bacterium]
MKKKLQVTLELLPEVPGVYIFLNKEREILYIGKAKNLQKRVNTYFHKTTQDRPRIIQMLPLIDDVEIKETNNEIEALILESVLIKKYKPPYNTELKDDKSYAWLYINVKDDFPTVKIVRTFKKGEYSEGKLFGPYPSGVLIRRVYSYLRRLYPFCTCKNRDCKSSLYYHIGLCPGPYAGAISKEEYRENIDNIIGILSGRKKNHIQLLQKQMEEYSKEENYEKAAQLRDRIEDLKYISQNIDFTYYDRIELYESRREKVLRLSFQQLGLELGIKDLRRIECYDISNIQGKHAYGSMVVATDGKINRSKYRVFKIRESNSPNDFEMMKEVLKRRFKNSEESPQLILIDGGKGHVSSASKVIPSGITVMGISEKKSSNLLDTFWISREKEISKIDIKNPKILINLRDEAHRFALSFFRKQSIKQLKQSELDNIKGVGSKRKKALLEVFRNVDEIKKASFENIYEVIKNKTVVNNIKEYFSNPSHQ